MPIAVFSSAQRAKVAMKTGVGARGGDSNRNVLTRFDAFFLMVTDTGRPALGHTDG